MTITYPVKNNLYINITNRCPCSCTFCLRNNGESVFGSGNLWLEHEPTYEEICKAMKEASENEFKGIIEYTDEPVVSSDFISDPHTSIFDATAGIMLTDTFVKLVAWYDNEWGYSNKLVDLACYMSSVDHK